MNSVSSVSSTDVCFTHRDFKTYMFLLMCLLWYILYILYKQKEEMSNVDFTSHLKEDELRSKVKLLENELYNLQLSEQRCQSDLTESKEILKNMSTQFARPRVGEVVREVPREGGVKVNIDAQKTALLNKIYDPLISPERMYPGGRLNTPRVNSFQMIGYVYQESGNERYPLFGRYKFPGKTDKWEYYVIDETRNRLKIPFKSINDNELYDGDTISIPSVGSGYKVKMYEYDNFRYDPDVL